MSQRSRKRTRRSCQNQAECTDSKDGGRSASKKVAGPVKKRGVSKTEPDAKPHDCHANDAVDYASAEYWEERYKGGIPSLEWYCGFEHINPLFERFVPKESRVLDVGCGDSPLCWELRDAGYTGHITSIDYSPSVVKKLLADKKSGTRRGDHGLEFKVLDARELPFKSGSFDVVISKGTVDALMCDDAGREKARATCREAARVTAPGGWFVMVSHVHPSSAECEELLSEALLVGLRDSDPEKEALWSVDAHCAELEEDEHGHRHGDEGDEDAGRATEIGPSVYMIRKTAKKRTRSSTSKKPLDIPFRVHEY